ncbi:MAG: ABC transporter ATP-binding protein [Planctomycetaceae bacterium]|nr:ABC transporter ATP-binding protein [Planctomycetaceae bacterium]
MNTPIAVEMQDVCRSFGTGKDITLAVDHLTLSVPRGSIYGLLGANGAGKTTSIRMMVSHLKPDQGTIRVLGEDPAEQSTDMRRRIAYISENMQIPRWMSMEDAVGFCKPLYPNWNEPLYKELLKTFDLKPTRRYEESSKGQRRAMCIIIALCQEPEVLIMDEPASGLDTLARRHFLSELLKVTCDENKTVLFSSHILGDIERTVDRVAILMRGQMVLEGELDSLKERVRRIIFRTESDKLEEPRTDLFRTLRSIRDRSSLYWVVTDFEPSKFVQLRESLPDSVAVEVEGFNLEELFMESIESSREAA